MGTFGTLRLAAARLGVVAGAVMLGRPKFVNAPRPQR
jgi:hypothetical protein